MAFRYFEHSWLGSYYHTAEFDMSTAVEDCLYQLINPMILSNSGWSWDTSLCPESKPIKLIPSNRIYAAFIQHTSGAKAMIGYCYNKMNSTKATDGSCGNTSSTLSTWYEPGFLTSKTGLAANSIMCGLFFSFITADSVNNESANFHPEYSIRDELFYDSKMSQITSLVNIEFSSSYNAYPDYQSYVSTMLKRKTDSTQCTHFLLVDTEAPVLILGSGLTPNKKNMAIFGEVATGQKRYPYDILGTSSFSSLLGCHYSSATSSTAASYNFGEDTQVPNRATSSNNSYLSNSICVKFFNTSGQYSLSNSPFCLGYPWMGSSPRTMGTLCDAKRIWYDNIKTLHISGLTPSQIYNNNEWCFLGGGDGEAVSSSSESRTCNSQFSCYSSSYIKGSSVYYNYNLGIVIKWDNDFNGGNRIPINV